MKKFTKRQIRQVLSGLPFGEKLDVVLAKRVIRHGKLAVYVPVEALFAIYSKALQDITAHGATTPTYFEAGVFAGDSMATWWRAVDAAEVPMRAFGADSFQGLPPEVESDEGGWEEGMFWCPRPATEWNLRRMGVPLDNVELVEGWFNESLTPDLGERIGSVNVAMLDADAYSSTVPVLEFLTPLLADPAWMIFDDWFSGGNMDPSTVTGRGTGVERAFAEWLDRNPEWSSTDQGDYDLDVRTAGKVFRLTRHDE